MRSRPRRRLRQPSASRAGRGHSRPDDGLSTRPSSRNIAPRTALDIAQRVPGFTLDLGSNQTSQRQVDVRGFAGTAGNVVINGARPSTKAETLDVTLSRIPAQQVVRVEVGPGDLYGSDYAGKSQVLNIILSAAGGHRRQRHRVGEALVHRLCEHRHLRARR